MPKNMNSVPTAPKKCGRGYECVNPEKGILPTNAFTRNPSSSDKLQKNCKVCCDSDAAKRRELKRKSIEPSTPTSTPTPTSTDSPSESTQPSSSSRTTQQISPATIRRCKSGKHCRNKKKPKGSISLLPLDEFEGDNPHCKACRPSDMKQCKKAQYCTNAKKFGFGMLPLTEFDDHNYCKVCWLSESEKLEEKAKKKEQVEKDGKICCKGDECVNPKKRSDGTLPI